jgi:hypothetical protein
VIAPMIIYFTETMPDRHHRMEQLQDRSAPLSIGHQPLTGNPVGIGSALASKLLAPRPILSTVAMYRMAATFRHTLNPNSSEDSSAPGRR